MAERYTNLRVVVDRLMRNPLLEDLTWDAAIQYTVDFLGIVGNPRMFIEKEVDIPITSYRGILPNDWVDTISVFYMGKDTSVKMPSGGLPVRYSTSTSNLDSDAYDGMVEATYMIQNSIIVFSLETAIIKMSYRAIAVDENDGAPLLIDNASFIRALETYIKLQHYTILFELGKVIPAVYNNLQQQYAWAVGACESEMLRLDLPRAESFFNMYSTLIIRGNEYNNKFKNSGSKEFLISH